MGEYNPQEDSQLDEGIKAYVVLFNEHGVETYESCEGGNDHPYPEPTIRFSGDRSEGFRALALALGHGIKVVALKRIWTINDGEPTGPYWEMVFHSDKLNGARLDAIDRRWKHITRCSVGFSESTLSTIPAFITPCMVGL